MTYVSANDSNSTDTVKTQDIPVKENNTIKTNDTGNSISDNSTYEKTTPSINISSNKLNAKDTLEIYLQNSTGTPLKSKKLNITLNNKLYSLETNSKGTVKLSINLNAKTYKLTVAFAGDDNYTAVSKYFNINVYKLKTKITESANFIVKGNYLYFHLTDSRGDSVSGKKLTIKYHGKTYSKKTNSNGRITIKIKSKTSINVKYKGDNQYEDSFKKLTVHVTSSRSIKIGNSRLLTKGYLRVYLKVNGKSVSKKITLYIGDKKLTKKSNSEGIAVFKPNVKANHYTVKAKVGKYYSSKNIRCHIGNVKNPLREPIPYKKGKPDIDLMPGSYVMGDGNAKYTLKKSQYREVLKRDSYCLFLNSKLTKYTFFKTKNHPKLNHIIKREKWNVIEREINKKLVKANKYGYWPGKITVSLKGKSYTYPEIKDVQNTGYTCGPASCSMCSQALKNYVCEKHVAKLAHSKPIAGTSCDAMMKALKKNNFICTYFYKSSFNSALKELKKGGTALIFHANNHYVSILDISSNGKKVLVSNSYGTYDNIPTKWMKVSYMKKKFSPRWDESLIVKLNYKLSNSIKNSINSYYTSFGTKWHKHNTHQSIGRI